MNNDAVSTIFMVSQCRASDIELRRLIAISRSRNRKRGVSGCIFSTAHYFAYVLEGKTAELSRIIKTLCLDGRQAAPRILVQCAIEYRRFGEWPLAHLDAQEFESTLADAYRGRYPLATLRILLELLVQDHFEQLDPGGWSPIPPGNPQQTISVMRRVPLPSRI
jgi:hypothetical protein